jgi:hypothetical protein
MTDWASLLRKELDDREGGLAGAVGLKAGMSGPDFEETLGSLLRWHDLQPLNERFRGLTGPKPGSWIDATVNAETQAKARLATIIEGSNTSLFRDRPSKPRHAS